MSTSPNPESPALHAPIPADDIPIPGTSTDAVALPGERPSDPIAAEEPNAAPTAPPAVTPDTPGPGAPPARPLDAAEVGRRLKQQFPALFAGPVKPVKLRIQVDLQQRAPGAFTRQALSAFFRRHTSATSYLVAVTQAPHRFDLDGQPAGEIADEHRRLASEELARRRGNRESRENEAALLEQQRRNRATLLRDFEQTTLTASNFSALKAVPEAELDGLLDLARRERAERPAEPEHGFRHRGPPPRSATGPLPFVKPGSAAPPSLSRRPKPPREAASPGRPPRRR